jgi:hypothetical protein
LIGNSGFREGSAWLCQMASHQDRVWLQDRGGSGGPRFRCAQDISRLICDPFPSRPTPMTLTCKSGTTWNVPMTCIVLPAGNGGRVGGNGSGRCGVSTLSRDANSQVKHPLQVSQMAERSIVIPQGVQQSNCLISTFMLSSPSPSSTSNDVQRNGSPEGSLILSVLRWSHRES